MISSATDSSYNFCPYSKKNIGIAAALIIVSSLGLLFLSLGLKRHFSSSVTNTAFMISGRALLTLEMLGFIAYGLFKCFRKESSQQAVLKKEEFSGSSKLSDQDSIQVTKNLEPFVEDSRTVSQNLARLVEIRSFEEELNKPIEEEFRESSKSSDEDIFNQDSIQVTKKHEPLVEDSRTVSQNLKKQAEILSLEEGLSKWIEEEEGVLEAVELIKNAFLKDMDTLDLGFFNLKTLPEVIGMLKKLKELDLSNNQLEALPSGIGELYNLKTLNLGNNNLSTLPSEINNLENLEVLFLSFNSFMTIPSKLEKVKNLYLTGNQMVTLSSDIREFRNLEKLDLSKNQLKALPKEMGELLNLQLLDISNNQLTTLPEEMKNLVNIRFLYLSNNPFKTFPEELKEWINKKTPHQYVLLKGLE